ncbi:MAG: hypothetical protein CBC04_06525 [Verrucomicrobia bacterium TMED44]|nr:MAG: hypothetical protein CBC04_06525 [Verrucomicrobia bacterium TMED44]|tara:strand:- start:540 stop:731 length:192 start_codon:yes stop_codon:yes gene_type:complete
MIPLKIMRENDNFLLSVDGVIKKTAGIKRKRPNCPKVEFMVDIMKIKTLKKSRVAKKTRYVLK